MSDLTLHGSHRQVSKEFRAWREQFHRDASDMTASLIRDIRHSTQIVILWMAIFSLANVVVISLLLCFLVARQ